MMGSTVEQTTTLGGTAAQIRVAKIAHGLLNMTWGKHIPDEVCFATIKAGVNLLPPGVRMILNSGDFYDDNFGPGNLEMLSRFYEAYPEYADKTFLSVKGGIRLATPQNLERCLIGIRAALRGTKHVDLFECARVDQTIPIEDVMRSMQHLMAEGHFDHVGISECSARTLRRAHAVHPVAMVEIEVSPWSIEEETQQVLAAAQELDVAVAAYSPLGRGFLTGAVKSINDIPEDDRRRELSRFKGENFEHNRAMVRALEGVAERKGITTAAMCLSWVASLGPKVIPVPGSSNPERHAKNVLAGDIVVTPEESAEMWDIVGRYEIKGDRYFGGDAKANRLWG